MVAMDELINDGRPFTGGRDNQLGIARAEFRQLVTTNRIRPIFRGVYVDSAAGDSRTLRASALHLVKPEGAVFYGATVAFLMGVDVFAPKDRFNFAPQCVVPHHQGRCRRSWVTCHEGYLPKHDLMEIEGLAVTTLVRSTVDMLRSMWRPYALAAADAMAHAGLVSREEVMVYIAPMKRYPGIIQARALAAMIEPLSESPGESHQRLRVIDAGLPTPAAQIVVVDRFGRYVIRLDNGYPEAKVGMEYDGREFHEDDVAEEKDQLVREYLTGPLGWRLAVAKRGRIFGADPSYEQEIGTWLGISARPRWW